MTRCNVWSRRKNVLHVATRQQTVLPFVSQYITVKQRIVKLNTMQININSDHQRHTHLKLRHLQYVKARDVTLLVPAYRRSNVEEQDRTWQDISVCTQTHVLSIRLTTYSTFQHNKYSQNYARTDCRPAVVCVQSHLNQVAQKQFTNN